ncbi:MAG: bifunctional riboflavin kinase/FAD synthetase [Bacteroidetes bacterium]|nr:bifunctional riboflavin kinase/FAD synthetase [Bacteroidota bacterium]
MKVYYRLQDFKKLDKAVVTTGTFDGVHLGHQTILNRLKEIALREGAETVVLTFDPHPRIVIYNDTNIRLITTLPEKIEWLEKQGIDHLIVIPFTKEFSRISSIDFIRNILVGIIGTSKLVIGYNHLFGRNREGSFEHLKEYGPVYGFDVEEIPAQEINNVDISSTKIREALEVGNIVLANNYLGHSFSLRGKVVEGNQKGRTIGFPTANIHIDDQHKMIPGVGVYVVKVLMEGKEWGGMMNIGFRPTIKEEENINIEVNVFDFSGDIYGREIVILPLQKIRDEQKFASLDKLKEQLQQDRVRSMEILK